MPSTPGKLPDLHFLAHIERFHHHEAHEAHAGQCGHFWYLGSAKAAKIYNLDTPLAIPEGHEECDALTEAGYAAYLPLGEVRSQCQTVEGHRQQRKHQETTLRQERIAVKLQDGDGALRFQVKWCEVPTCCSIQLILNMLNSI